MKTKIIITFLICANFLSVYGQQEDKKDVEKKWQVGINLNTVEPAYDFVLSGHLIGRDHRKDKSFSLGIFGSYNIKNNCSLRLSIKRTRYYVIENYDNRGFSNPSSTYELDTLNAKQIVWNFSPSVIWCFPYKKFNFYCGFQLTYKNYGMIKGNSIYTEWYYATNDTSVYISNYQTEAGGFSLGGGPLGGFQVFLLKNVSVGGELNINYSYYKLGGDIISIQDNVLNHTIDVPNITKQTFVGFEFSHILSSITISFHF